tara:strand:- start:4788 stop:5279 length:492 start_codon:yes stop_codon:yes gene_type:complete
MRILICFFLFFGCNSQFRVDCDINNYFISPNKNNNTGFLKNQREIVTTFSEKELESLFNETSISCKNVLANFFYCNICFNSDRNYLISYSGERFDLDSSSNPNIFTNNIISLISAMQIGSEEYEYFLSSEKNNFSKKEEMLIKNVFQTQKPDSKIESIQIKTH